MARIIPLPFDPHRKVEALLPWYARGQLDPSEHEQVEAHLARCPACREELAFETRLAGAISAAPPDPEEGWARMRARIEQQQLGRGAAPAARRDRRRRAGAGWAAVMQPGVGWAVAASLLVVAGGAEVWRTWTQPDRFHALSAAQTPAAAGNLVVIFKPETSEASMRALLKAAHARIVDGPSAADAYVLATPKAGRAAALARLRADPALVLVEPVDGTGTP